ncbi:glycosyltransferase family 4 protein [Dactylosporangium sp. CA-092794]|uniref:glycosyltransferase family 4 protein n=1 Tax=Dactylosporangium sp. CA-092794 TaxID=3239929 RepID=UPI003D8A7F32
MTPPSLTATAVAALAAVPLSAVLTAGCRRAALRCGLVDRPGGHKRHAAPTPYLGGVAVVGATLLPALAVAATGPAPAGTLLLAVAALSVAAVGLADDVAPLGMTGRLAAEAVAATLVVLGGHTLVVSGLPWLDGALTVAWIVLVTNAFNLLDNMDGAAASAAVATAVLLGAATAGAGSAVLWWCLAGGCAGFLWHNRPPARIFLGDTGSLFVGFVVAAGTVAAAPDRSLSTVVVPVALALPALVDTTLVVISRRRAGRSWHDGGTDHVAHRLRRLGLSAGQVPAVLAGAAALSGGLGLAVLGAAVPAATALAGAVAAGTTAVLLLLRVPVYAGPIDPPSPALSAAARTSQPAPDRSH